MPNELPYTELTDEVTRNLAQMCSENVRRYPDVLVYCQKNQANEYEGITWTTLYDEILNIAWNLRRAGVTSGTKVILYCPNSLDMLRAELAIMASGAIAVPIFAYFKMNTAALLINHSDAEYIILAGQYQINELHAVLPKIRTVWSFDHVTYSGPHLVRDFSELLVQRQDNSFTLSSDANPNDVCLNMYTSGTMGIPKCVQLTHRNILSQQAAIRSVLDITKNDRFLSYLPWHHSFGGIFELFSALYNGATYHLESSLGKDASSIISNWNIVHPTVFYSVPKIYQSLIEIASSNQEASKTLFDTGLRFVFSAASSLSKRLSDEFTSRKIKVIEGWGLTETSPCCTITNPAVEREPGVVGLPIPGVRVRIADDGEVQVSGPNVMVKYYNNDVANADAFCEDGWYRTGDVGAITPNGLKLITRKDRIFKLSNGEKVIPTDLERAIELKCHYVQYTVVAGNGEDFPVALIFPNRRLLDNPDLSISPEQGCACPRNLSEFGKCLTTCLQNANLSIGQKFAKIKMAAIIDDELSIDNSMLTPSMKVAPKNVIEKYKAHLSILYGNHTPADEEVYVVEMNPYLFR